MQKIALIIPCYNEEKRLNKENIFSLLHQTEMTVYFANDGSTDQTRSLIASFCEENNERLKLLDFTENAGKANVISKSVNEILKKNEYDFIGYFDADFSTPVSEVVKITEVLKDRETQFVFGSRVLLLNSGIKRKWQRHIIGRVIITFINLKFKLGIYDTQCGAKWFSSSIAKQVFDTPFFTSWLFDVEIFIRLKAKNLLDSGKEFPIQNWKDVEGSKLSWKTAFKIAKELFVLAKKY